MYITNRSVATTIILSIVACGIYYYVWMYQTSQEVNNILLGAGRFSGFPLFINITQNTHTVNLG